MTTLRTLIWFVVAAVAMLGAVWLAERPGCLTAEWQGWRLDTSVGALLVTVVVLILVSIGAWLLYRWIVGAPGALLEGWGESRRRRGYRELTQGLAAVAAGDGAEAQKHARKAEQLLSEPALTLLLSAQAAQLTGDRDGAQRAFNAMLEDEQMAFLGLRGLIGQALRDGDQSKALALAERAFKLRPQTPWVVHSLFDMQAQTGQWRAAQETLESGIRRKVVTQDKGRALKALLEVERSREAEREGRTSDALALAREAFGLAPERIAATQRLAELQIKTGDKKKAMRTIERRLGRGAASRSRAALSRSVGRERGAEADRRGAAAGRPGSGRHRKPHCAGAGLARSRSVGRGAASSRNRGRHQPAGARLPPHGRGRGARAIRSREGPRVAGEGRRRAGRPQLAVRLVRCASRSLAAGLRELRRLRHAAVARAGHLWPDPAARTGAGLPARLFSTSLRRQRRRCTSSS